MDSNNVFKGDNMPYRVVVIGRNYTSRLGMIRAVGMAGCDVIVIKTNGAPGTKDIDAYSKYVKDYLYAREPDREQLISVLQTTKADGVKTIVIPVDDYAASTIDENIELLKKNFVFPNINMEQGAINRFMDKSFQKDLAQKSGLKVVNGWVINIVDHKYILPPDIVYPVFPKPQISFKGNKRCMRECKTEKELCMVLDEVAEKIDCPILIEQYISIEKEYGVLGMCEKGKSILPGLVEKVSIGRGTHKGVTKLGVVTSLEEKPFLKEKLQCFLEKTHLTGLCDIDLYESNGVIYFNELNLRFGAFGYSILCAGVNLPNFLIHTLLKSKVCIEPVNIRNKAICLSEKVNSEDFFAGYYGWKEYNRIKKMANFFFIEDKNDPEPYKIFRKQFASKLVKNYIKGIIGRNG